VIEVPRTTAFVLVCVLAALGGCFLANQPPPPIRPGFTLYAPGVGPEDVLAAVKQHEHEIPERGVIMPVGVRGSGDDLLVIDVLVVVAKEEAGEYSKPPLNWPRSMLFRSVHGTLAQRDAADGKGFSLRMPGGEPVRTRRFDRSPQLQEQTRARYGLVADLEAPEVDIDIQGRAYRATVLAVPIGCVGELPVGADICVRMTRTDSLGNEELFGAVRSRRELCTLVMPLSERGDGAPP